MARLFLTTILLALSACSAEQVASGAPAEVPTGENAFRGEELATYKEKIRGEFPGVVGTSVDELAARLEAGDVPLLLDVRAREEFAVSHLPGAMHAEGVEQALALIRSDATDPGRDVVVYCSIGYRSARLARELEASGVEGVLNLEGSIFEWANTGHAVYRGGRPVDEVHPYDADWGRMLDRSLWSTGR